MNTADTQSLSVKPKSKRKLILIFLAGVFLLLAVAFILTMPPSEPSGFLSAVELANSPDCREHYSYPTQFKTFKETEAAAKRGDKDAQFFLGWVYHRDSVDKHPDSVTVTDRMNQLLKKIHFSIGNPDEKTSVRWLRLAAEQGQPNAQSLLCDASGDNVKKGYLTAQEFQKWQRSAAEKGDWIAQLNLGYGFIFARTNMVEGYQWLFLANQKNPDTNRAASLKRAYSRMSPDERQESERRIKQYNDTCKTMPAH